MNNIDEIYEHIINESIKEDKTDIIDHLIEEMAELTCELMNYKRGKPSKIIFEMSDVYFQINKYLKINNLSKLDLIGIAIQKTEKQFPHQMPKY